MPTLATTKPFVGRAQDYPAGTQIPPHRHVGHQIIHAVAGVMRVESEGGLWVTPPGRAVWMPADRAHAIRCVTEVRMRTVYFDPSAASLGVDRASVEVWSVSGLMREILTRLATDATPKGAPHLLALLALEIDAVAAEPAALPHPSHPGLRRIAAALTEDPADARSLRQWAATLGLGERTLIRRFLAETGMSFRQWRRQARMIAALERLGAGGAVTTVALDVGYGDPSAFIAAFRETFGCAPGAYFS